MIGLLPGGEGRHGTDTNPAGDNSSHTGILTEILNFDFFYKKFCHKNIFISLNDSFFFPIKSITIFLCTIK